MGNWGRRGKEKWGFTGIIGANGGKWGAGGGVEGGKEKSNFTKKIWGNGAKQGRRWKPIAITACFVLSCGHHGTPCYT